MAVTRGSEIGGPQAADNAELQARLEEAEETLRAIRAGEVDALVVSTSDGERLFTLRGADHSYRDLVERMNEGALSLAGDGLIVYANQRFAAMLQVPLEEVLGSHLQAWMAPESQEALETALANAQHQQYRSEMMIAAADGSRVPVNLSLNRVPIEGLQDSLGVVATDLTEQKRAERAIRLSEEKFRNVFENSLLGKRLVGMDGRLEVNKTFSDITGYSEAELQQKSWEEYTHPDDVAATAQAFKQLMDGSAENIRLEKRYIHKNGGTVWVDATFTVGRDEAGQPLYILVAVNDITARKQADAALLDLKQHMQQNIEMERLRLAQDLHDLPLQQLYGVIYRLEELRVVADSLTADSLSQAIAGIQQTLGALRTVASELRPPALSRFGLEKAIRSYMQEYREKNPQTRVQLLLARDHQLLPEDVRLVLFRVLQEATANAKRHADATEIQVRFNFDAEEARLEVSDNGRGFAVPADWLSLVRTGHYGLAGMAERVSAAGGQLEITSAAGEPTRVRATIRYAAG